MTTCSRDLSTHFAPSLSLIVTMVESSCRREQQAHLRWHLPPHRHTTPPSDLPLPFPDLHNTISGNPLPRQATCHVQALPAVRWASTPALPASPSKDPDPRLFAPPAAQRWDPKWGNSHVDTFNRKTPATWLHIGEAPRRVWIVSGWKRRVQILIQESLLVEGGKVADECRAQLYRAESELEKERSGANSQSQVGRRTLADRTTISNQHAAAAYVYLPYVRRKLVTTAVGH